MRAVWVDENNDPAYAKINAAGIKTLYFAARDPRVTKAYLQSQVSKGYGVGIYLAWNWDGFGDIASAASAYMKKLRWGNSFPKVQFDIELHDPDYISDNLTRWRQAYPHQDTSWTMEGMQGGWMNESVFKQSIFNLHIRLAPQCYWGSEGKIEGEWASDMVLRDLTSGGTGYPESIVSMFYDAANLHRGWDGFAFTMGRLPQ